MKTIALLILASIFIMGTANATGFSLGGKDLWLEYCTGQSNAFNEKSSKAMCHTALLMYWAGYTHSQHDRNEEPVLCPGTLNNSIVDEFAKYLEETDLNDETDFIYLANGFFSKFSQCK